MPSYRIVIANPGTHKRRNAKKKTAKKKTTKKKVAKKTTKRKTAKKKTAKKTTKRATAKKTAKKTTKRATAKKTAKKTTKRATAKKTAKKTTKRSTAKKKTTKKRVAATALVKRARTLKRGTSPQGTRERLTRKQMLDRIQNLASLDQSIGSWLRANEDATKKEIRAIEADLRKALKSNAGCKYAALRYGNTAQSCNKKHPVPKGLMTRGLVSRGKSTGAKVLGEWSRKTKWRKAPSLHDEKFWGD